MDYVIHILILGVFYAIMGAWRENTKSGQAFTHFLQTWETDWVTGIGIAFLIVLSPMVLVCVLSDLGFIH